MSIHLGCFFVLSIVLVLSGGEKRVYGDFENKEEEEIAKSSKLSKTQYILWAQNIHIYTAAILRWLYLCRKKLQENIIRFMIELQQQISINPLQIKNQSSLKSGMAIVRHIGVKPK
jgi:hypothetical protein